MRIRNFLAAALVLLAGCAQDIHVDRMLLNPQSLLMAVGDTQTLSPEFVSGNATTVEWVTDNQEVATVSQDGTVTAVAPGSAIITCRSAEGLYAACDVFVRGYKSELVAGVQLFHHDLTLHLGENVQMIASIIPETAVNQNVMWRSSSTGVAYVNSSGFLRTLIQGTAVITVTTEEGGFQDFCNVTVLPPYIYVEGIGLAQQQCSLNVGESAQLEAEIIPEDASNPNVTWASLDDSIVTVTQEGVITGIAPGTAGVKVTTEEGGFKAYCLVTVFEPSGSEE
ncbi:MAG: Ig domain-containing protein [Bacteroidales bacterium]|nr:Ig domain-containing protein [Bacteroidales bacterium]